MIKSFAGSVGILCALATLPAAATPDRGLSSAFKTAADKAGPGVHVKVVAVGAPQSSIEAFEKGLTQNNALNELLRGANYRVLYTEAADEREEQTLIPAQEFRSVIYDYDHQRAVVAEGALSEPAKAVARVENDWQPAVTDDEFSDAVAVLMNDGAFNSALASGAAAIYQPMPPIEGLNHHAPIRQRIINVGLMPRGDAENFAAEIVGVDLAMRKVIRYPNRAPATARVGEPSQACGLPTAHQGTTKRGTPGKYELIVTDDDGNTLWDMQVVRPSASAGVNGSGIELYHVTYKGQAVFKAAHSPILNVRYDDDACGPFRDWEWQEGMFQADGTDIAPGFRDCGTTPAQTILDDGTDEGNFRGVALYTVGTEVFLVTEMEAGWYRYIFEWGFEADGAIHPRFGFGNVTNYCTCFGRTHHAYFRFDFDAASRANSIFESPLDNADGRGKLIATEEKIIRSLNAPKVYHIRGRAGHSYTLYPGANDGVADSYAEGDMWFLHWHDGASPLLAEIDDGPHYYQFEAKAQLDQFLTGESLTKQDSVIWYHASYYSPGGNSPLLARGPKGNLTGPAVVGPDLIPAGY